MRLQSIAVVALLCCAACSTPPPRSADTQESAAAETSAPPAVESTNPTESVPLRVVMTDQTTDGHVMLMRGRIINPHTVPVTGVRLQIVFIIPDGEGGGKVQEIQQKEVGSTIPPGGSTPLRWDVDSMYASGAGQFIVAAYPKRLGDKDMPPPDNWKE